MHLHCGLLRIAFRVCAFILFFAIFGIGSLGNAFQQQSDSNKPQAAASTAAPNGQDVNLPNIPPPKFRLYRFGTDAPTTYIISVDATDEQIRSLLWFLRQKVRTGAFKDIGITDRTTMQFGELGYAWGMLVVYRGERCAEENYLSDGEIAAAGEIGGPCGDGEHADGTYRWGIGGDPLKDSGTIRAKNGEVVEVFNYKDNWHPSSKAPNHSTSK